MTVAINDNTALKPIGKNMKLTFVGSLDKSLEVAIQTTSHWQQKWTQIQADKIYIQ